MAYVNCDIMEKKKDVPRIIDPLLTSSSAICVTKWLYVPLGAFSPTEEYSNGLQYASPLWT